MNGTPRDFQLEDGSRVGVVGGGPAGSFFTYFLLQMAGRFGLEIEVDVYEPRDFSRPGPQGCNMCGGIISESLVQNLALEGINLPDTVVQRGIDSYCLHMDVGDVRIDTPLHEKRIAAVHRGCGPKDMREVLYAGFDHFLQDLAAGKGARMVRSRVAGVEREEGLPRVTTQDGEQKTYDLLAFAVGVNTSALKLLTSLGLEYRPPKCTKTYIRELGLGANAIREHLGSSMHVFLLDLPRLEFAALIPKGDYVTLCLLGDDIDKALIQAFLDSPEVRRCLPLDWSPWVDCCHCAPRINIEGAVTPYADRMVFVGDCGTTRLYKDGIGAAYRTAKAAAKTAVFEGVSAEHFREHFWPECRSIRDDNRLGKIVFGLCRQVQKRRFARRALLETVSEEQRAGGGRTSTVLWDTFTGSAPYRGILAQMAHPSSVFRLARKTVTSVWSQEPRGHPERTP